MLYIRRVVYFPPYQNYGRIWAFGVDRMTRKQPIKPDDPAEYQRFLETAKQVEADETPGSFDRAFKKIVKAKPKKQ